jgi:hypothetical protein
VIALVIMASMPLVGCVGNQSPPDATPIDQVAMWNQILMDGVARTRKVIVALPNVSPEQKAKWLAALDLVTTYDDLGVVIFELTTVTKTIPAPPASTQPTSFQMQLHDWRRIDARRVVALPEPLNLDKRIRACSRSDC